MERMIITGSEGLIGSSLSSHLAKTYKILKLSRRFGHDLTDEDFVKKWFAKNKAEYLVNCYGLNDHVTKAGMKNTLYDIPLKEIEDFIRVNVISLLSVCREFAKNKEAKGIVNIASIYGVVSPSPRLYGKNEKHIGYPISKGAVVQLTRHMAAHLAPRVRVNCLVPGGIGHMQPKGFIKRYSEKVPLRRMMRKDELNGIVEYLCSDKSSYMTGSIVTIDGGWTII